MAKLGNSANTEKIGRFLAENIGAAVYAERSILAPSQSPRGVPRPIRVASRSSRLSDKIKMEPPDMVGSPASPGGQVSPAPAGAIGGHMVKPPVSPQHYGGGTMYTVSPQASSPIGQGIYYTQQSPSHASNLGVPVGPASGATAPRIPSPHHQYYLSPGASYSPEAPVGAVVSSGYVPVLSNPPAPAISQLLDLDSQKCIDQNPIELDMNNINSAELRSLLPSESDFNASMVDAHLSENLSSNLNIIDPPPHTNKLNSKTSLGASTSVPYVLNIPHQPKQESGGQTGSDSLNNLKSEIELLNQLSSAQ